MNNKEYDVIIGLEIHIQCKTESKMLCKCPANYFGKDPNTQTCPICLGLPNTEILLPNRRAVELCILLGLATKCDIDNEIAFYRKHYSYPDLPKGYQITQYDRPICSDGEIDVYDEKDKKHTIEIERIHPEEDVAKLIREKEGNKDYFLIDYNKAGVPLLEIVTKPDIKSAYLAKEYANSIRQLVRYLDISDADMEKGQMRCEPNISLQERGKWEYKDGKILPLGDYSLNPKVEIKNIGSISAVEKAIDFEVNRIISELEKGKQIEQQTRGWNAERGITEYQRMKEEAEDYNYTPDPDVPLIDITTEDIEKIAKELVELPNEKRARYISEFSLSDYDSRVLTADRRISEYYEKLLKILSKEMPIEKAAKASSNWLTGAVFAISNEKGIDINEDTIPLPSLSYLILEFEKKVLTRNKAEELLKESLEKKKDLKKLIQETIEQSKKSIENLDTIVESVIQENPKAVNDYKNGKNATIGFLVGQVMHKTEGSTDPNKAKLILEEKLNG